MTSNLLALVLHEWPSREHFREAIFREYVGPHRFTVTSMVSPTPGNVRLVFRGEGTTITFEYAEDEFATDADLHAWALLALDEYIGRMEEADWDRAS